MCVCGEELPTAPKCLNTPEIVFQKIYGYRYLCKIKIWRVKINYHFYEFFMQNIRSQYFWLQEDPDVLLRYPVTYVIPSQWYIHPKKKICSLSLICWKSTQGQFEECLYVKHFSEKFENSGRILLVRGVKVVPFRKYWFELNVWNKKFGAFLTKQVLKIFWPWKVLIADMRLSRGSAASRGLHQWEKWK